MKTTSLFFVSLASALVLCMPGCATNPNALPTRTLAAEDRTEAGVQRMEQAMRDTPDDRELRSQYFRQRELVVADLLYQAQLAMDARHLDAAENLYLRAQKIEPSHPRLQQALADIAAQRREAAKSQPSPGAEPDAMQEIVLAPGMRKPITLEFRDTPLKSVFEVISRSAGINFVFDKDVRAETKVTIFVRNTQIDEIIKLILVTNQLQQKLLNENSILIYPNTAAKIKDYQELVTRTFYLANADVKQAQSMIRSLVKTKDLFADEKLNLLVIKDTPDAVRLAERLLASLDMAEPEVMLDVEVLEITRSKLQELGMQFPDQVGYGLLQPTTSSTIVNGGVTQTSTALGGTLAAGFVDLNNTAALTPYVSNPSLLLNLKNQVGDGNMLANPRIRVKNREKAKIHIGDKLPVFTTTSTANVGVAASVSYLDVGLKLEVEPNVYLGDEVGIKVGLEVSSIVKEVAGPSGSLAYQVGTRSAATALRLKNGETQILAGLINDEERSSANRLPGLGDIPVLGRLFSSQRDSKNKTEIVLLITPRVVRNLVRPDAAQNTFSAGSESAVGAPALRLQPSAPRSIGLSSSGGGVVRAPEAELVEPPPAEALAPVAENVEAFVDPEASPAAKPEPAL